MKNLNKIIYGICGCLLLSSCGSTDPYSFLNPKLPVKQVFALDKSGNKAIVDFWVLPKKDDLADDFMIAFNCHVNDERKLLDVLEAIDHGKVKIPVRVKVFFIQNQMESLVSTMDHDDFMYSVDTANLPSGVEKPIAPTEEKLREHIAFIHGYSNDSNSVQAFVSRFHLKEYGHYRISLETLTAQPVFENTVTEIEVKKYYSGAISTKGTI